MNKHLPFALLALLLAGCAQPAAPLLAGLGGAFDASSRAWTDGDAEFLARVLAAEARGELKAQPQSVAGVAYVMMRTARREGVGIEVLVTQKQPWLLTSYKEGPRGVNGKYYHTLRKDQIGDYAALEAIARKSFTGYDPTNIDPNHFYDDSIANNPPAWSKGPGVKKKQLGHFIFVHNPKDA